MLQSLIVNVLALIVTLGILVTFHEFGHFWVARRCGVKVLRFSIGFGKPLYSWYGKDGTEYAIAPIPLGGYVRMLGQDDLDTSAGHEATASERARNFNYKPLWQRFAIVSAGPLANFLLAILVFWLINVMYGQRGVAPVIADVVPESPAWEAGLRSGDEITAVDGEPVTIWQQVTMQLLNRLGESGTLLLDAVPEGETAEREYRLPLQNWLAGTTEPNPLGSLGLVRFIIPPVIDGVTEDGRARQAGLQPGDRVISAAGEPVSSWTRWVQIIREHPELPLDITVERAGSTEALSLVPQRSRDEEGNEIGVIGAWVEPYDLAANLPDEQRRDIRFNPVSAVAPALQETWDKSVFVLESIRKMVVGLISYRNVNGPITIAQVAGETAGYGLEVYLGFLAILSISLGVLNLLPIPMLDGGHLLYYTIEAIIRRPVPEGVQAMGLQFGLVIITGIMMLAIFNDLNRLF
ncbi:MAG: RIP metalloprotease RseP [Pseudohongiellaceae bacterium]